MYENKQAYTLDDCAFICSYGALNRMIKSKNTAKVEIFTRMKSQVNAINYNNLSKLDRDTEGLQLWLVAFIACMEFADKNFQPTLEYNQEQAKEIMQYAYIACDRFMTDLFSMGGTHSKNFLTISGSFLTTCNLKAINKRTGHYLYFTEFVEKFSRPVSVLEYLRNTLKDKEIEYLRLVYRENMEDEDIMEKFGMDKKTYSKFKRDIRSHISKKYQSPEEFIDAFITDKLKK